ncbi:MAG: type II toxin-antitoxin system VapC family toxin [Desulfamplus sp.]|nr:type II toxin-antitoxin system VapC family toxin [Desulfamplus sp.]
MKTVFVDTSALIAIGNKRDAFHIKAVNVKNYLHQNNIHFVTTSGILLEFGNAFSPVNLRYTYVKMIEAITYSKKWNSVYIDNQIFNSAFELYKQMQDKSWGIVDCTSFIVARNMGIDEIFTTDHHFEQAGFQILLK